MSPVHYLPTAEHSAPRKVAVSLKSAAWSGILWMFAQHIGARVISLGSQVVLARLLDPTDFAKYALAGTFTVLATIIASFGIEDVLLRRQKNAGPWLTPATVTSIGLGLVCFAATFAAGPLMAAFYKTPELRTVLPLMGLGLSFTAAATVPAAMLRSAMRFKLISAVGLLELLLAQILTIALAAMHMGVFSFVLPLPIVAAVRCAALWLIVRPRLGSISRRRVLLIMAPGLAVLGGRLLDNVIGQGDYIVLGLLASQAVVGAYYFAFRLAILPVGLLANNLGAVLLPSLARLRNDPVRQAEAALKAGRLLAFVIMPICMLQAIVARPLIPSLFGPRWSASIAIVEILSLGLGFESLCWVGQCLMLSKGQFKRGFVYTALKVPAFFFAAWFGTRIAPGPGTAVAVCVYYVVTAPAFTCLAFAGTATKQTELLGLFAKPAAMAAAAALPGLALGRHLGSQGATLAALETCAFGLGYLLLSAAFARSELHEVLGRLPVVRSMRFVGRAASSV